MSKALCRNTFQFSELNDLPVFMDIGLSCLVLFIYKQQMN